MINFLLATLFDIKEDVKRNVKEETPQTDAVRHLNPRALILKRQARDKIVPNIPLAFNYKRERKREENPIMKIKRFVQKMSSTESEKRNKKSANETKGIFLKEKSHGKRESAITTITTTTNSEMENKSQGTLGSIGDEQQPAENIIKTFKTENTSLPSISVRRFHDKLNSSKNSSSGSSGEEETDEQRQRNTRSLTAGGVATRKINEQSRKSLSENNKPPIITRNALYERAVPFEEVKSLEIVRRALTDEQFEKLKFLDDQKVSHVSFCL